MSKRLVIYPLLAVVGMIAIFLSHEQFSLAPTPLPKRAFTEALLATRELTVKPPEEIQIILVGDIMLSRNVATAIKKSKDPTLPFQALGDFLLSSDFNFGNLESPFAPPLSSPARGGDPPAGRAGEEDVGGGIIGGHSLIFSAPRDNIKGLAEYNFKILNLANNHALDQGLSGLKYTRQFLTANNIQPVGAGESLVQAWEPAIIKVRGKKIGFLAASYASANDGGNSENGYVARIEDLENLKLKISQLKSISDFIIVSMHAGNEYTHLPNQAQKDFARAALDAGADVVVGHHPHWIQPIERYKDGLIFYSLGNFIFDQEWSQKTKQGLAVKLTILGDKLKSIELVPVILENYCCPRLAKEKETQIILQNINATSTIIKF